MNIIRIQDKVLNSERIHRAVDQILQLRQEGLSQQEVATRLNIDRTLISRLESLGEIRKGPRLALVGFPIANTEELTAVAQTEGVDFILLMSDKERWRFVEEKSGAELINEFMALVSQAKNYDAVIFIGSDMRIKLMEAILGSRIISWEIGISPIKEDRWVNPEQLRQLIRQLKNADLHPVLPRQKE
ncbi:MAG TPA: transcriptional regulator [Desulfotomaculum sp.]|nr:transcriptional regulator [Desulfotomaculum sp.]HCJ79039.1 transcriptional regulator [Desulfotomaculum sp.]